MKKFLISLLIILFASMAWAIPPAPIPPIRCTDCTPFIGDGVLCYNTSTDKFYVGNGTTAIEIVNASNFIFPAAGVPVYDTDSDFILYLKAGSDITANKNLTFTTGDSDRTITLSGNPTLADWFDQAVKAASAVTFGTVDTGQGANELYDMDQNVLAASAVTFATVDTGQGANELYDMDQDVLTTSSPTFKTPEGDGHASVGLTAVQVSNTIIHNIGQGAADCSLTLPAAAVGYSFILQVGEPSANYLRITAASGDQMIVDGEVGKTYASFATPGRGNYLTCHSFKELVGAALAIGTTTTAVGSNAFTYTIGATKYAKAAVAAGTAPGNDVIVAIKYGAVAFDIGTNGTIDAVEATNQAAAQFTTADAAIAALPAVEAAHWRMGYITATKSDGTFTFGTTALNAANSTVTYTSTAGTSTYNWIVSTGAGIVTMD